MSKTLETDKYQFSTLLGDSQRKKIELPPFQRSFSWEKMHVTTFLDDLTKFEEEFALQPVRATYFLGSIVLIEEDETLLLLDGQQRLATATIVFAALRDIARALNKGDNKGNDLARDIQRAFIEKNSETVYALTLSELDEPFFLKAIKSDPPAVPVHKLKSHRLLKGAYDLTRSRLETLISGKGYEDAIVRLRSVRDALSKGMLLVGMKVGNEEDAYMIFETLNDRGLRLSVPDLVLNLLMRRCTDDSARSLVRQYWDTSLKTLGKKDVSRFLRHLWVSRYGDLKSEGLYKAIKSDLEKSKLNSVTFASQCSEECDLYVSLLDGNVSLPTKQGARNLAGIVRYLYISSAPPLLLAGFGCLNVTDFERLMEAIVGTYLRYVVVTNQNPIDIETSFFEAARELRTTVENGGNSSKALQAALAILKTRRVEDTKLDEASPDTYLERAEAVWLMAELAITMQSATKELGMNETNLEHIFPLKPQVTAWPTHEALGALAWHLGNLTVLSEKLNQRSQNKGYVEKRDQFYAKSEVEMTKKVLPYPTWDEASIKARSSELMKVIAQRWPAL